MTNHKPLSDKYFRKVKAKDALARWSITVGGIGIIAVVIGMLVLIASVAMPLFFDARTRPVTEIAASGAPIVAISERAERCGNWLAARRSTLDEPAERAMFVSASAQVATLLASLGQLLGRGPFQAVRVCVSVVS